MNKILLLGSVLLLAACSADNGGRAMGSLERDRLTFTATASENVVLINVAEGDVVHKGDVLLQLDGTRASAYLAAQQAQLEQATARLQELQNGARSEERSAALARTQGAQAELTAATQQLNRVSALHAQNMLGQADVDAAQARKDSAAATLRQLQAQQRELNNGTRNEQLNQAQAAVANATALYQVAQKNLADLTINAPVDGLVDALPWHVGDRVNTGTVLLTMLSAGDAYARVYVPATRLAALPKGAEVNVHIDGLSQVLSGQVSHVRSQPAFTPYYALNERDRAALMYLAEIRFSGTAGAVLQNIPAGTGLEVILP
ncbi:MAG: HlyD family efflux transporter periplasmic adaptor subunit [Oceanospirillaceae bacterium]|nr:HlyD family efflux transporter periplasmic adaptor subunit [Oceanospirillaceae bacterium]MCP5351239.1 HlyD family efflux transporter periplasmic adaptor subunit [Oceanospirillaceae bacterium]